MQENIECEEDALVKKSGQWVRAQITQRKITTWSQGEKVKEGEVCRVWGLEWILTKWCRCLCAHLQLLCEKCFHPPSYIRSFNYCVVGDCTGPGAVVRLSNMEGNCLKCQMGASVETVSHNAKEEPLTLYIPQEKPESLLCFKMLPWFHRSLIQKSDLLLEKTVNCEF